MGSLLYDAENNECRTVASVTDSTTVEIDAAFTYSDLTNVLIGQRPGLPNITGYSDQFDANTGWARQIDVHGAFYEEDISSRGALTGDSSSVYPWGRFGFDASKSNSIYGASTEVQPSNITIKIWKRIS